MGNRLQLRFLRSITLKVPYNSRLSCNITCYLFGELTRRSSLGQLSVPPDVASGGTTSLERKNVQKLSKELLTHSGPFAIVRSHTVNTNYKHMRTKALLCAAALAAGAVTAMAQSNVYSLNVVGYINTTLVGSAAGKYQMIANQLN